MEFAKSLAQWSVTDPLVPQSIHQSWPTVPASHDGRRWNSHPFLCFTSMLVHWSTSPQKNKLANQNSIFSVTFVGIKNYLLKENVFYCGYKLEAGSTEFIDTRDSNLAYAQAIGYGKWSCIIVSYIYTISIQEYASTKDLVSIWWVIFLCRRWCQNQVVIRNVHRVRYLNDTVSYRSICYHLSK